MKNNYLKCIFSLFVLLTFTWIISCSGRPGKAPAETGSQDIKSVVEEEPGINLITMIAPEENSDFRLGEGVKVILEKDNRGEDPDSILIFFNGQTVASLDQGNWEHLIPSFLINTTGRKSIKVSAYRKGKARTTITRFIVIMSDVVPVRNSYRIINTYPHERNAFTQGLFYDNGVLYEGTGQETGSSLREVELETGKVIRQLNLDPSLFGEGITLYDDRIYQVTWTSQVGFVYEKETFRQINKVNYQSQGWGLATVNDHIVMSEGSDVLYFLEPEMFTVVSRLEVYDNEKKVDQLNELEYINGEIWANIWMSDLIARIDPESGKVLAYIDLRGLMKDPDAGVLNGIAYDKEGNRIFVTGKNWPNLFEIRLTE